jgi:4-hydroxy-3-methylbut-2-enyl diphosphate reductase
VGLILILGAQNSSNTLRLAEVARSAGAEAILVSSLEDLPVPKLAARCDIGLTAGASTPETFIAEILAHLATHGFSHTETLGTSREEIHFSLPPAFR